MKELLIEQALFGRDGDKTLAWGKSPGFRDEWIPPAEELMRGFGERPSNLVCPHAVFAHPLTAAPGVREAPNWVAVVEVADQPNGILGFHFLMIARKEYEAYLGDPFQLVKKFPAAWLQRGELPTLSLAEPLPPRTVADVRAVLQRLKANALPDDWDESEESFSCEPPASAAPQGEQAAKTAIAAGLPPSLERTVENSESPALLGGTQVLVDGGKLVFIRARPGPHLIEGLWTLLPNSTRSRLWPASFAFSNRLGFDALAVPFIRPGDNYQGYTSEEQAIDYPEGRYEMSVQLAAENGDQHQLDLLFGRRSVHETWRLAWTLLAVMLVFVALGWVMKLFMPVLPPELTPQDISRRTCLAATLVGIGDPYTAVMVLDAGKKIKVQE